MWIAIAMWYGSDIMNATIEMQRCLFAAASAAMAKRTAASERKNSLQLKPGNFRMAPTIHLFCKCG